MEIDYRHSLEEADARARLHALGEYLDNRHGIQRHVARRQPRPASRASTWS